MNDKARMVYLPRGAPCLSLPLLRPLATVAVSGGVLADSRVQAFAKFSQNIRGFHREMIESVYQGFIVYLLELMPRSNISVNANAVSIGQGHISFHFWFLSIVGVAPDDRAQAGDCHARFSS